MEIWNDVVGYEGLYQVSNYGRVKSFLKFHGTNERIMKPCFDKYGYLQITLKPKGIKPKCFRVHTLVATAFLGKSKLTVNHKDGDKLNNNVDNLEWISYRKNLKHAFDNKLIKSTKINLVSQNETLKFDSMHECSFYLGKSRNFIKERLKSGRNMKIGDYEIKVIV